MNSTEQMVSVPRIDAELMAEPAAPKERISIRRHEAMFRTRGLLAKPAAQHQGEPVAWASPQALEAFKDVGWMHVGAKDGGSAIPLYTHADAGEVEQGYHHSVVERLVNRQNELREERDTLRAQLAEAHALLRESYAELMAIKAAIGFRGTTLALIGRIDAALSASAEPSAPTCETCSGHGAIGNILNAEPCPDCSYSAPVLRDERSDFETECKKRGFSIERLPSGEYLIPAVRFAWNGWQNRAALERNPADSTPLHGILTYMQKRRDLYADAVKNAAIPNPGDMGRLDELDVQIAALKEVLS